MQGEDAYDGISTWRRGLEDEGSSRKSVGREGTAKSQGRENHHAGEELTRTD